MCESRNARCDVPGGPVTILTLLFEESTVASRGCSMETRAKGAFRVARTRVGERGYGALLLVLGNRLKRRLEESEVAYPDFLPCVQTRFLTA